MLFYPFYLDVKSFYKHQSHYFYFLQESENQDNFENLSEDSEIKSDLLYRRGGSYERIGEYEKADKDLLYSLKDIEFTFNLFGYISFRSGLSLVSSFFLVIFLITIR